MLENPKPQYESGETVDTVSELTEALIRQPKGFMLLFKTPWSDLYQLWSKVEKESGQKITISIKNSCSLGDKPACLVEVKVI